MAPCLLLDYLTGPLALLSVAKLTALVLRRSGVLLALAVATLAGTNDQPSMSRTLRTPKKERQYLTRVANLSAYLLRIAHQTGKDDRLGRDLNRHIVVGTRRPESHTHV